MSRLGSQTKQDKTRKDKKIKDDETSGKNLLFSEKRAKKETTTLVAKGGSLGEIDFPNYFLKTVALTLINPMSNCGLRLEKNFLEKNFLKFGETKPSQKIYMRHGNFGTWIPCAHKKTGSSD